MKDWNWHVLLGAGDRTADAMERKRTRAEQNKIQTKQQEQQNIEEGVALRQIEYFLYNLKELVAILLVIPSEHRIQNFYHPVHPATST